MKKKILLVLFWFLFSFVILCVLMIFDGYEPGEFFLTGTILAGIFTAVMSLWKFIVAPCFSRFLRILIMS